MNDAPIEASSALRPLVLAIDVGSSSTRVQLHDARGRPIAGTFRDRGRRWETDAAGAAWTDATAVLEELDALLDALVAEHAGLVAEVTAGAISCLFHTFCGVDADRSPVTPLRSWADVSAAPATTALRETLDSGAVRQRTGAPLHPGYWPARILAERPAGVAAGVAGWAGLPELLHHRFTGTWRLGRSLAAGTGLRDRHGETWDTELCAAIGIDPEALAPVERELVLVPTGEEAAARWPALRDVRWLAPIGDGACNNIGLGAVGAGRAAVMIGTSAAMRLVLDGDLATIPEGCFAYGLEGDRTLLGGALSEGGGTAAWWSELTQRPLDDAAEHSVASDAVALPYLSGERAPGYHVDATGTIAGLRGTDGAEAMLRAIMTAVALGLGEIDAALGSPASVIASGGALRRSPTWQRLVAAALDRPIDVASLVEPSLRGAALLALEAAGVRRIDAVEPITTQRVAPAEEEVAALRMAAARRRRLYERLLARQD